MDKEKLKSSLIESIKEFRTGEYEEDVYEYLIEIQNIKFKVGITDNELEQATDIAIEIIEELKTLPNAGFSKKEFSEIQSQCDAIKKNSPLEKIMVMSQIQTDNIKQLIKRAADVMRVGGAYYMFLSYPCITNTLYAVYEVVIDHLEDEDMLDCSTYFLLRGILKMRGTEI